MRIRRLRRWLVCSGIVSVLVGGFGAVPAEAEPYSDFYIFGNSLSDSGNVLARTFGFFPPDPPYFDGRFSDGPVWVEYVAGGLDLVVVANGSNPNQINGNNFAFGGAEAAANVPIFPFGVLPSVQNQVQMFVSAIGTAPGDALYSVWGGGNDLRDAVNPGSGLNERQQQLVAEDAVDAILNAVTMLATAGAQNIVVPNLPDLGVTPEATVLGNQAGSTQLTIQYNVLLAVGLEDLAAQLDVNIIPIDTFGLLGLIIEDALDNGGAIYGITNIDDPIAPGLPGSPRDAPSAEDPATALWSDDIHPSTAAHALLADFVLAQLNSAPADLDGDGTVNAADLALLLGSWGPCPGCPADLDDDGAVTAADLALLLGGWG